jgi:hypothetical protein
MRLSCGSCPLMPSLMSRVTPAKNSCSEGDGWAHEARSPASRGITITVATHRASADTRAALVWRARAEIAVPSPTKQPR